MAVGIIEEDIFRQKGKNLSTLLRSSHFPREERIIVDTNCSLVLIRVSKKDLSGNIYSNIAVQKTKIWYLVEMGMAQAYHTKVDY